MPCRDGAQVGGVYAKGGATKGGYGFNDRSHEGSGLTGNQQLPVDLSSIGRLKATCPIFEDGHGDHGY